DYVKQPEGMPDAPKLAEEVKCPACGKAMLQRFGPRGPFLGCSGYPECKRTMRISAEGKSEVNAKRTEHRGEKCGSAVVSRRGRRGPFLACTGYPKCKNAKDVDSQGNPIKPIETGVQCDKCGSAMIVRKGPRGPFLACSAYPKCRSSKPLSPELKEKLKDVLPPPPPKKEMPKFETTETCDECGSAMKLRQGRQGYFLGCSKYPKCKGTRELPPDSQERLGGGPP